MVMLSQKWLCPVREAWRKVDITGRQQDCVSVCNFVRIECIVIPHFPRQTRLDPCASRDPRGIFGL